ncbi:MAG: D-beta-D-heptose 1-phosphate adenosyltransferase [Mycobacterium sp.]|nr:D-beta-D-heptose 1-phosphate adenosyltransferase [Mycobacterium sp.]
MMAKPLVIIGDSMLDIDIDGTATRLSPEAPVPVVDADRMWRRPGGAGLAAVLAARADPDVVLVTALAGDGSGRVLRDLLSASGLRVLPLTMTGTTVCKTRIRAGGQSVLRLDQGGGVVSDDDVPRPIAGLLEEARAICVADYGNGVTAHPGIRSLLTELATRIPVVWDPHPRGAPPTPGCALVTPNHVEAQYFAASGESGSNSVEALRERWQAAAVCVTRGDRGALLFDREGECAHIPVPSLATLGAGRSDACGAGDRFAVAAALELGAGADPQAAVAAAVEAAARFVAAGGASGVSTAAALWGSGNGVAAREFGREFVLEAATTPAAIDDLREKVRRRGGTLVATGGCFDLLHTGHVRLLRQARQLGDALIVLINSDDSVRALKGAGRPVMAAQDRARVLSALACVDAVCVFEELSPEDALDRLKPDVWVKGGDYVAADLPEADVVRRHGGEVILLPTVPGYSSTNLIAAARS